MHYLIAETAETSEAQCQHPVSLASAAAVLSLFGQKDEKVLCQGMVRHDFLPGS
jgi:hypothetical protein